MKILIICPYPINTAPSQRFKYEQYINYLKKKGYQINVSSFFSNSTYFILQKKGFYLIKIFSIIFGYFKRTLELFTLKQYNGVYIHLSVVPFTNVVFEKLFIKFSNKIIYDIDDLVFLLKTSQVNWIASYLKSSEKFFFLMKKANYVVTCTPHLHEIAKKHNSKTIDISSTINTEQYFIKNFNINKKIIIGWSGSFSTGPYLKLIENALKKVLSKNNAKLLVIGAKEKYIKDLDYELLPWTPDNEVKDLQKIDIGLYPLPNEEWVYGKSGLKALQFMALGIPVVASAIGTNFRVVDHEINGYLAKDENDWINYIEILCKNHEKRKEMGILAREKVVKEFSVNANKEKYLKVFDQTFKNIG